MSTDGKGRRSLRDRIAVVPARIQSSAEFVESFKPPQWTVRGLMQSGYFYSLTAKTGTGKTAIGLLMAYSVATGQKFGPFRTVKGRVLYLAGENPDDVRMRWIQMAHKLDFDPSDIDVDFIPGVQSMDTIQTALANHHDVALIVLDTTAAYFLSSSEGEENSNEAIGRFAQGLRKLLEAQEGTRKCSLVALAHPTKHATQQEDLLPRGGGAFINETDGNYTLWAESDDDPVQLWWTAKPPRGARIEPSYFVLEVGTSPRLVDTDGESIKTVTARAINETEHKSLVDAASARRTKVLQAISELPEGSLMDWAEHANICADEGAQRGQPSKSKVQTVLKALVSEGLVKKEAGKYNLTKAGKEFAKSLKAF